MTEDVDQGRSQQKMPGLLPQRQTGILLAVTKQFLSQRGLANAKPFLESRLTTNVDVHSIISDRSSACHIQLVPAYEDYEYVQDGDIIIGGLFSVNYLMGSLAVSEMAHQHPLVCMVPLSQLYRNLQIFLFTIDQLNKDQSLLPNLTVGYHIYDPCAHPMKAIRNVLQMLSGPGATVPNYSCKRNWRLTGFIGDQSSTTTLPIAELLAVHKYPLISYGATLSSSSSPRFLRTIQNDGETFPGLIKLLKYFGWNWVGIIGTNDESGEREASLLKRILKQHDICVGFEATETFTTLDKKTPDDPMNDGILRKLSVQVAIVCGTYQELVLGTKIRKFLEGMTIIWAPSWAPHIVLLKKYPKVFNGSLSLEPRSWVTTEYQHFIDGFYPLKRPKDLLLQSLWMVNFHCLSGNREKDKLYKAFYKISLRNCTGLESIPGTWNIISDEMFDPVYDAVWLMAKALNPLNLSINDWYGNEASYRNQLRRNLKRVVYRGHSVNNEAGELITKYSFYNNIISNGRLLRVPVGVFRPYSSENNRTFVNLSLITWKTINNEIPKAWCTESCLPGSRKIQNRRKTLCCYGCLPCSEGEISNRTDSENCMKCPDHQWPNDNKTECKSKRVDFLSYTEDKISAIVIAGSVFFVIVTGFILGIFVLYRKTPIIKANNRNLSYVLLISIMLSFLCVFLFLGRPVDGTCMLRQISTGILLSISVSSLLAKTIMVYIAFKATKPGSVWRTWTGVKVPNYVLLTCSSVQVVICMCWVTLSPPFQEVDTQTYNDKVMVQCNEGSNLWFSSVLGYMGILATVSFILAFLARKLPDTFNEAKYITFSMLVFCSVWIAMIPAYLSTRGKYMVAVEIFAILTSNAGLLGCIFLPKCYIILFKPELNTRKHLLETKNTMSHH
ncbi:vomeronasal type-2 receptor 26-like [Engystomops pustulosus]|uniref:vomeronasal type-2 receptor 26-like n=1 Tax=Engystomops pustulosus TaxID=76066 RepID=UPI003AFA6BCD